MGKDEREKFPAGSHDVSNKMDPIETTNHNAILPAPSIDTRILKIFR
jgi:hypothetical protein